MSLFNFFRSEVTRLMLAGFVVGSLAVGAVQSSDATAATPATETAR